MRTLTLTLTALLTACALTACHQHTDSTPPDWTVAPCSWWADTSTPTLPPYTYTDRCAAPDGTIIFSH